MPDQVAAKAPLVSGRRIVFLCLLTIGAITIVVLQTRSVVESAHQFLRLTGRLALALFIASFGASTFNRIFKTNWARFLLTNRRYLGVSTAITLWLHFSVILMLIGFESGWKDTNAPFLILAPGTVTFILIGLMGLTSNNIAQQRLGRTNWKRLHLAGGYAALFAFIFEYVLQLFLTPANMTVTLPPLFAYLLLGLTVGFLILRLLKRQLSK